MKPIAQLQLDWPAWRLSFSEYGELKGYDLSQTEATTDWLDHENFDGPEFLYTFGEYESDAERNA